MLMLAVLAAGCGSSTHVVTGQSFVTSPGTATLPSTTSARTTTPTSTSPSTPVAAPVALAPLTRIASSIVVLNGTVNPQGVPTAYSFHYGTSTRYGGLAPNPPLALGAGSSAITVSARIAYLVPGTTYHYKLTASKAGHEISTGDATFTTPPGKNGTSGPAH